MKPEALEAIAGQTMRPSALEAATSPSSDSGTAQLDGTPSGKKAPERPERSSTTPNQPPTPFGQMTDGTQSAAEVVEEVVHGVKTVVDGVIAWAEKKAEQLSSGSDSTGPYTSPATCAPSDLDPIASGVLPAMLVQEKVERVGPPEEHNDEDDGDVDEMESDNKDKDMDNEEIDRPDGKNNRERTL